MGKLMGSRRLPSSRGESTDRTRQLNRLCLIFAPDIDREGGNMTSRKIMIYVAMAALALIISGVSAARAATQFGDIYPERCQYSGNGVYYYYPQGYRVGSAGTSSAGGTWGCAATNGRTMGRSWSAPSRAVTAENAITGCRNGNTGGNCRVVSCSGSVRTRDEAHAVLHR